MGGGKWKSGKISLLFPRFLIFQLHDVLLAWLIPRLCLHPLSRFRIMRQTTKIRLCQRQAMVHFVPFFLFFFIFEEDSLFCVVDDDQLFISVAAKRRWSFGYMSFPFD